MIALADESEGDFEFEIVERNKKNDKIEIFAGLSSEVFVDQYESAKRVLNYKNSKGRKREYPVWRRVPYWEYSWGMTKEDFPELYPEFKTKSNDE